MDKGNSNREQQLSINYHSLSVKEALKELKSSENGLTNHEAEMRLHQHGFNELKGEERTHPVRILLQQFSSPLVWMLLVALAISLFLAMRETGSTTLQQYADAIVIGAIVLLNSVLGFVQEFKAERSIEALKKMVSLKAKVLRNGKEAKIDSKFLVPGDILVLTAGDKVPADARILEAYSLYTQESSLTGESLPVGKSIETLPEKTPLADRKNMVYSSTAIPKGRGKALITNIGMSTEVGKIAKLIKESPQEATPLQKKLRDLGKYLILAVIMIVLVVFIIRLLSGESLVETLLIAIALAIAAIPEGLPAVITISLAVGVQRMSQRNALVRHLPSVETLGSVNVICTDKTGTLTHDEMTVTKIWASGTVYDVSGSGYGTEGAFYVDTKLADPKPLQLLLKIGSLCSDAVVEDKKENNKDGQKNVVGDPTEAALVIAAEKAGFTKKELQKNEPLIDEIPFLSERKMMTTIHKAPKGTVSYPKGAADVVIERCNRILVNGTVQRLDRAMKKEVYAQNELFAKEALRVLGFAYKDTFTDSASAEKEMIFVGLQAMIDPPRKEAQKSIALCKKAGIKVIMITGDHLGTAKAIAEQLGIEGKAVSGQDLEQMPNLKKEIEKIGVFARVNPEHKLQIVTALKEKGYIVAMTGDGVNDAPALKKADIGIAMGKTGTDVAKEAADMVLADDNFTSIVNAVEEGRGIFDTIKKFVNYLLSSNLGEILVIFFASILQLPLPLTAIQILWVNMITDGLPATALSVDPHSAGIMERPPKSAKESILSKELRWSIILIGSLIGIVCTVLFWLYQASGAQKARTIVFTSLVVFELVRLQTIRSEFKLGIFSNKWLIAAVAASILLHLLTIYTPLSSFFKTVPLNLVDWAVLAVAGAVLFGTYMLIQLLRRKIRK